MGTDEQLGRQRFFRTRVQENAGDLHVSSGSLLREDKIFTGKKLLSSDTDCIDYHFFPILMLFGNVDNFSGEFKNRVVELTEEGANAQYLTWSQVSDTVKFEVETLLSQIYGLTNTPRISFDSLKGTGNAVSGMTFDYVFMSTHLNVENLNETVGEFMQRRVNFLVSALGSVNSTLEAASESIDMDV